MSIILDPSEFDDLSQMAESTGDRPVLVIPPLAVAKLKEELDAEQPAMTHAEVQVRMLIALEYLEASRVALASAIDALLPAIEACARGNEGRGKES